MDLNLQGRRALITGGTRGIGRAIAERLADEGCDIGLCARDAAQVAAAVEALSARGKRATGDALDVSDSDALQAWVDRCAETLGGIDIYVSNVSALSGGNELASWKRSIDVDMLGCVVGVETAIPHLTKSDQGSIVIIATTGAWEAFGQRKPYAAVKAANLSYMKYLARDLAPEGVRVNGVSPGSIYFEDGTWGRRRREEPDKYQMMLDMNPMGRMGKPEEVANAVAFLSSPAAGFISGTNLVVDGAMSARVQF